jgi:hypothetical protein
MQLIAIVIGGALKVWDDLAIALAMTEGYARLIVATNYAGRDYEGDIDAWVTLHPEQFAAWAKERAERGRNIDYRLFVPAHRAGVGGEVVTQDGSGSSGLFAAQIALQELGCAGAIWCGVPMDAEASHYLRRGPWTTHEIYRPAFEAAKAKGWNIRSLSGWTREAFGAPDAEWLNSLSLDPASPPPVRQYHQGEPDMWVRITANHSYAIPGRPAHIAYKTGMELSVTRHCRDELVAAGKAEDMPSPNREQKASRLKLRATKEDHSATQIKSENGTENAR